jgi:hypothetical protein
MSTSTTARQEPHTRFSLPGLNLSLNWTPHGAYTEYNRAGKTPFPAQGDGKDLFRTALNDADVDGGWTSLNLTPLREFTMLQIMNILTDKRGWEEKVCRESEKYPF